MFIFNINLRDFFLPFLAPRVTSCVIFFSKPFLTNLKVNDNVVFDLIMSFRDMNIIEG